VRLCIGVDGEGGDGEVIYLMYSFCFD